MGEKSGVMRNRRPYHKPQLEQVQLVAEEAVLKGCKSAGLGGPDISGCLRTDSTKKCNALQT